MYPFSTSSFNDETCLAKSGDVRWATRLLEYAVIIRRLNIVQKDTKARAGPTYDFALGKFPKSSIPIITNDTDKILLLPKINETKQIYSL